MKFLFSNLLNEGGPLFMYTNLIILILCIALIVIAFTKKEKAEKLTNLIKHLSLFALVWGFFGFFIGMIYAFDSISLANDIAPSVLAGGLKIGLLSPSLGMIVFLIARLGIMVLILKKK